MLKRRMLAGVAALLMGLYLLAIAPVVSAANPAVQGSRVSFSGTWRTIAGGTHQYTVILKQVGNEVTGSYSPGNGKILDGVVTDNKLTFNWTQDGGNEGTAEFTMDEDGKGFTGSATALKPREFNVSSNTYKPEPAEFAGTWETVTNGQYSVPLTIVQTGNRVTGIYPGNNGKIEGAVTGKVLRFKWESDGGSGSGRFVMDDSNWAFSGTYNRGEDPDEVEATWNGTRPSGKGGKTRPAVSVAGVWNALTSTGHFQLILKQAADQVTGSIRLPGQDGVFYLDEGTLVGSTLRFKFGFKKKNDSSGQFVMDEDRKSLKGKIGEETMLFILAN